MTADRRSRFFSIIFVLVLGLAVPALSEGGDRGRDQAIASDIRMLRDSIHEPPDLAERPWAPFVLQEAVNYCDPGFWGAAEQFGRDCGIEADKFRLASVLLAQAVVSRSLDQFLDPADPRLQEISRKLKLPPQDAAKTIDALAVVVGVPVNACNCLAKGLVRAVMGDGPATEEQLMKIDGLTDLFQLRGFLQSVRAVWMNPNRFGQMVRDAFSEDPSGAIDTGLGPTQVGGWLDRIGGIWTSTDVAKWSDAMVSADRARTAFEACQVEGALVEQAKVLPKLLLWSDYRRRWIHHAEVQRFCNENWALTLEEWSATLHVPVSALRQLPGMTDPAEAIGTGLESLIEDYTRDLQQIKDLGILDPAWARPARIKEKRTEVDEIVRLLDELSNLTDSASSNCDVGPAISAIRDIDQHSACFAVAAGAGAKNELTGQLELLRELQLAFRALRPTLDPPLASGLERVAGCDLETWNEPMVEALASFDQLYPNFRAESLRRCWEGDWPPSVLAREKARRDEELAIATGAARGKLDAALSLIDACRFDETEPLLLDVINLVGGAGCSVSSESCMNESYNPVICSLQLIFQQAVEARGDLSSRREAFAQAADEVVRIGGDLMAWADEQQGFLDGPGRCSALGYLPAIATDLEGLGPPAGCDDTSIGQIPLFRQRAAELRAVVKSYRDQETSEIEAAVDTARLRFSDCDSEGLKIAADELQVLEAAACQGSNRGPEIAAWQLQLEDAAATAERIEVESNAKLAAWEDHCDESGIAGFAAGLSNLPECGWRSWDEYRRGELRARMAEVEVIRTVKIPKLRNLRRQLEARRRIGEGYLSSVNEAVALGLDACKEIQGLQRVVADAGGWLAHQLSGDQSLPLICFSDSLGEIRYLEKDLRRKLAAVNLDCPAQTAELPTTGNGGGGWGGKKLDDGFAGKRLEEPASSAADRVRASWCSGPRPAHEAALRKLVRASQPYDRESVLQAIAALSPARCPGDQEMLDRLRGPTVAAAEAEADSNTDKMMASSAWARGRARERAAAIATLVGAAQHELDRYQRSRAGSNGGGSAGTTGSARPPTTTAAGGRNCAIDFTVNNASYFDCNCAGWGFDPTYGKCREGFGDKYSSNPTAQPGKVVAGFGNEGGSGSGGSGELHPCEDSSVRVDAYVTKYAQLYGGGRESYELKGDIVCYRNGFDRISSGSIESYSCREESFGGCSRQKSTTVERRENKAGGVYSLYFNGGTAHWTISPK